MKTSAYRIFAGSAIRLSVLSVLLLGMAGACMARASAAAARTAAQAALTAVAPQAQPVAQPAATGETTEPAAKGTSEGIKVHGHWTIEVKNPDGALVTHREFENSLVPSGGGGASLLPALLEGNAVAGAWQIELESPVVNGAPSVVFLNIDEPNSAASWTCTDPATGGCSTNLTLVNPVLVNSNGTLSPAQPLTLQGSVLVAASPYTTIGFVQTANFACPSNAEGYGNVTPQVCFAPPGTIAYQPNAQPIPFTSRTLDGLNGDPPAVPVTAGQTVNVTVVISFQ